MGMVASYEYIYALVCMLTYVYVCMYRYINCVACGQGISRQYVRHVYMHVCMGA